MELTICSMTCRLGRYYLHIRRRYKSILASGSRQSLPVRWYLPLSLFCASFFPSRLVSFVSSIRIITFPLYLYVRDPQFGYLSIRIIILTERFPLKVDVEALRIEISEFTGIGVLCFNEHVLLCNQTALAYCV